MTDIMETRLMTKDFVDGSHPQYKYGYEQGQEDMRERAAQVCDQAAKSCPDKGSIQQMAQKASAAFIRALPLDTGES